jgi:hypothetical protein
MAAKTMVFLLATQRTAEHVNDYETGAGSI